MKKILLITTMAATLTALTALGQGNFIFGTGGGVVWNPGTGTRGGPFNVAFFWGTGTPAIGTLTGRDHTSTNAVSVHLATEWNAILGDVNYHLAMNTNTGTVAVGSLTAAGGVNYSSGNNFAVQGTSASGGTANVYMLAWDNTFATPALAQAGGATPGWSIPFAYNYSANPGAASGNFSTAASAAGVSIAFGALPIPEPATFALAGLGTAAMLIFRRRK
jgi:PEP-CTERM motif